MEATLIPDTQAGIMQKQQLSATYSDEWEQIELYPTDMLNGNNAVNPIHQYFTSAYGSDKGLYLMHWLADVDDWYGLCWYFFSVQAAERKRFFHHDQYFPAW